MTPKEDSAHDLDLTDSEDASEVPHGSLLELMTSVHFERQQKEMHLAARLHAEISSQSARLALSAAVG